MVEGEGRVGDLAAVELPTGTVVKASLLAYALPMAGLMGGMGLGALLFEKNSSIGAAILGFMGLAACLLAVFLTEKKRRTSAQWQPVLTRVLPQELYKKSTENEKGAQQT